MSELYSQRAGMIQNEAEGRGQGRARMSKWATSMIYLGHFQSPWRRRGIWGRRVREGDRPFLFSGWDNKISAHDVNLQLGGRRLPSCRCTNLLCDL